MRIITAVSALVLLVTGSWAGPRIEISPIVFKCGTINEGTLSTIQAPFTVRNTGDATLHIKSVRPGCSCTTVKYDSVIAPGKTGTITADVAIWVFRSELFTKSVTVTSDATNDSTVKFSVEALLMPFIDASVPMIVFQQSDTVLDMTVCSAKKDLVVRSVSFVTKQIAQGPKTKPLDLTTPMRFTWTPTDSTRAADRYRVYKLRLVKPTVKETMFGEFVMRTNHPSKAEFTLRGSAAE